MAQAREVGQVPDLDDADHDELVRLALLHGIDASQTTGQLRRQLKDEIG